MFAWGTFLLYAFVTSITPGPNNIMSMSLGIRLGFLRTLRFNFGALIGYTTVMLMCAFLCNTLNDLIPQIRLPMLIAGTLYLVWLAWKIDNTTYSTDPKNNEKVNPFLIGLTLQFVNVKIWFAGIVAMQLFIIPNYHDPLTLSFFSFLLAFIGVSCQLVWSGFGSLCAKLFARYTKPINIILALSLLYCAYTFW